MNAVVERYAFIRLCELKIHPHESTLWRTIVVGVINEITRLDIGRHNEPASGCRTRSRIGRIKGAGNPVKRPCTISRSIESSCTGTDIDYSLVAAIVWHHYKPASGIATGELHAIDRDTRQACGRSWCRNACNLGAVDNRRIHIARVLVVNDYPVTVCWSNRHVAQHIKLGNGLGY